MDFKAVAEKLARIRRTNGKLAKEALVREYSSDTDFMKVLKFIYNPYITTGLKAMKLENAGIAVNPPSLDAEYIMDYLSKNNTGTLVAAELANAFINDQEFPGGTWAAEGLVTKDLKIGVSATTINNVCGKGTIPIIGIMRGMHATKTNVNGTYIATEKIDGNRRIIMNKPTGVEIYTRSGRRDTGLQDIENEVAALLPKGYVYDTELIAVGDFKDSIALRQASASIANRRGQIRGGVKAMVFDMLTQAEYDAGISTTSAVGRKLMIATLFNDQQGIEKLCRYYNVGKATLLTAFSKLVFAPIVTEFIIGLPIISIVRTYEEAIAAAHPIWATGGEGLMLVEYSSAYEVNPNPRKTLLKIKATQEYNCVVKQIYEGKGRLEGTLGGITCTFEYKGKFYEVSVGSGFPDYLRDHYWLHPEEIIEHVVEIETFGVSMNQAGGYSLNCPIFKRVKGDVD